jgi:group I intron endonuclease
LVINLSKTFCIYALTDPVGTPFYVGRTNDIYRRILEHLVDAKKEAYPVHKKINRLLNIIGYDLSYVILVAGLSTLDVDNEEMYWIAYFKNIGIKLYNATNGGGGTFGHVPVFTDSWRAKLSIAAKKRVARGDNIIIGRIPTKDELKKRSLARCGKYTGKNNPFFGKQHSEETKKILAENAQDRFFGIPKTEDHRKRISVALKGKPKSEEHKRKNADRKGRQDPRVKTIMGTSPEGNKYVCIDGAKPFSVFINKLGHTLSQHAILDIANRKYKSTKTGWDFVFVDRPIDQEESIVEIGS